MFVARWQLASRFGKQDDVVSLLRKWEIDVGQRMGWKASSVRILSGFIGAADTEVEFEARFDNLNDLESAWKDMGGNPHHREYLKQFEAVVVSSAWKLYRDNDVVVGQG
jgi:hypothetical protein